MSSIFNRHSGNPVITIAEKLDAQHIVFLFKWFNKSVSMNFQSRSNPKTYSRCLIELHKQLMQSFDQRSNGQLRRHLRISDDIGVKNRDVAMLFSIKLAFEVGNKALMSWLICKKFILLYGAPLSLVKSLVNQRCTTKGGFKMNLRRNHHLMVAISGWVTQTLRAINNWKLITLGRFLKCRENFVDLQLKTEMALF